MKPLFTNNATSVLMSAIAADTTTLTLHADDAAAFPTVVSPDWFSLTISDPLGNMEIVHATARTGTSVTVLRGQEGTTAKAFDAGSRVAHRLTAAALNDLAIQLSALADVLNPGYATLADAMAAFVPALVQTITVGCYSEHDDGGGARYRRAASNPGHAGAFQSGDGAWWVIDSRTLLPPQFGAKKAMALDTNEPHLGVPDSTTHLLAWFAAMAALRRPGHIPDGYWRTEEALPGFDNMRITGNGRQSCLLKTTLKTVDDLAQPENPGWWSRWWPVIYVFQKSNIHLDSFRVLQDDGTEAVEYMATNGQTTFDYPHAPGEEPFVYVDGQDQIFAYACNAGAGTIQLRVPSTVLATADLTGGAVNTSTNVLTTVAAHGITTGAAICVDFAASGTRPNGLRLLKIYWARAISATELAFYYTPSHAGADTNRINLMSAGAGTLRIRQTDQNPITGVVTATAGTGDVTVEGTWDSVTYAHQDFDPAYNKEGHNAIAFPGYFQTTWPVALTSSGTMPPGLLADRIYYIRVTPVGLQFFNDPQEAMMGRNRIAITGTGSGTFTLRMQRRVHICRFTGFSSPSANRHVGILISECANVTVNGCAADGTFYNGINVENCTSYKITNCTTQGSTNRSIYVYSPRSNTAPFAQRGVVTGNEIDCRDIRSNTPICSYALALNSTGVRQAIAGLTVANNVISYPINFGISVTGLFHGVALANNSVAFAGRRALYIMESANAVAGRDNSDNVHVNGFSCYGLGYDGMGIYVNACNKTLIDGVEALGGLYSIFIAGVRDGATVRPAAHCTIANSILEETVGEAIYATMAPGLMVSAVQCLRNGGYALRVQQSPNANIDGVTAKDCRAEASAFFSDPANSIIRGLLLDSADAATGVRLAHQLASGDIPEGPTDWKTAISGVNVLNHTSNGLLVPVSGITSLRCEGHFGPSHFCGSPATIVINHSRPKSFVATTSGNITLAPSLTAEVFWYPVTMTANRSYTLSTSSISEGLEFTLVRTAAGAFNLTNALKDLAANQWATFVAENGAWRLKAFGSL